MSFSSDIEKFVKKCGTRGNTVIRKVVMDIGRSLIEKTPVGDATYWKSKPPAGYVGGHARANWSYSVGIRVIQQIDGTDKSGVNTLNKIIKNIPEQASGKVHYIQNSVPYIVPLEEGHSHQAPNGMVGLTEMEFKNFVKEALAEMK